MRQGMALGVACGGAAGDRRRRVRQGGGIPFEPGEMTSSPRVSKIIHSGEFGTTTNDSLKDEDNAGWVMDLPEPVRAEWLTSLQWIRLADRLVERETIEVTARASYDYGFHEFMLDWQKLRTTGTVPPSSPFRPLFEALGARWRRDALRESELQVWDAYLDALWTYRFPDRVVRTMRDYRAALYRLSGSFFQTLPFLPRDLREPAAFLGMLDQFFNNVRDLEEDTARGICYLPDDLLDQFGIARPQIPELVRSGDARLARVHEHLLTTLVPELLQTASPLLTANDLHASCAQMVHSVRTRHSRIEYVAKRCRFDVKAFARQYWALVSDDIASTRA